jgi:hypothetical protein
LGLLFGFMVKLLNGPLEPVSGDVGECRLHHGQEGRRDAAE